MKDAKEKAKELVEQFYNQPINFPYVDSEDGRCIGAGYMTHNTAKQCALIAVDNEIKSIIWLNNWCNYDNYMKEHIQNRILDLQKVKSEIENL